MSRNSKIQTPHRLASAGIAAVFALAMASPVLAADAPVTAKPDTTPQTGTMIHKHDDPTNLGTITVLGGAVRGNSEASWDDNDTSAPALPMVREQDAGKR